MITNNGFRKKQCQLDGNNIVFDGEFYTINSIKETPSYKGRMIFVYFLMAILTL